MTMNLFDEPERDAPGRIRHHKRCPYCKGLGVRTRGTSRTKDGIAALCGMCHGDGVITIGKD